MMELLASLSAPGALQLLLATAKLPAFASVLPAKLEVDDEEPPVTREWVNELCRTKHDGCAFWDNKEKQVEIRPKSDLVTFSIPDGFSTVADALALLEPLPFELGILGSPFSSEWSAADDNRRGFGRSTIDHGWGVIFRGKGHDRLASRRWLDFGPWRVLHLANDTTLVQFYDLAVPEAAAAYEQARPGHERMGISPTGGYIAWHMSNLLKNAGKGLYDPDTRSLQVVVAPGIVVTQAEMICNAALRLHHRLTRPAHNPIDRIAYVFIDMADARAHLHELWLRELECWAFNEQGQKVRLDLDYHPTPSPPEWVRRLDGR
jgi:hypothetical protein